MSRRPPPVLSAARAPSITTRRGDGGTTRLPAFGELPKHHPRIEALGALDELVCALGLARAASSLPARLRREIAALQRDLFRLGNALAGTRLPAPAARRLLARWSRRCAVLERSAAWPAGFVLPGATEAGARLDVARAAARRLERRVCALAADGLGERAALAALNRLSDYLWLLARAAEPEPDLLDDRARRRAPPGATR